MRNIIFSCTTYFKYVFARLFRPVFSEYVPQIILYREMLINLFIKFMWQPISHKMNLGSLQHIMKETVIKGKRALTKIISARKK